MNTRTRIAATAIIALLGLCAGRAQAQSAASGRDVDTQFAAYCNHLALTSGLPCDSVKKIARDSASRRVYASARAFYRQHKGVIEGTSTSSKTGKTGRSYIVIDPESEDIPLDSARIAYILTEWVKPENCK